MKSPAQPFLGLLHNASGGETRCVASLEGN